MAWTTPKTWASGYVVLAADLNTHLRDNLNVTAPAVLTTAGDILYASGANTPARLAKSTTSTQYLANTGTSNAPAWNEVALDTGVSATLPVANGGTNATALTDKAVLITQDSGTDTVAAVAMDANGELLIGGTSGPAVATLTAGTGVTITTGDGTITIASSAGGTATGTYTGDGSTGQAITGIGFQTKAIIITKRVTDVQNVDVGNWQMSSDVIEDDDASVAGQSWNWDNGSGRSTVLENRITAFGTDGFTVDDAGANLDPNASAVVYNYTVWG